MCEFEERSTAHSEGRGAVVRRIQRQQDGAGMLDWGSKQWEDRWLSRKVRRVIQDVLCD